ncbi:tyrosine-type recombinase/integrase [Hyphomonas sp.]|uniref:tyrosine-type recombinase/integrase n=1 Tax=Hyphomonas sp. TaxID=87 RepID=UPI003296B361
MKQEARTLAKHHPKNERMKRKYLAWLEEARRRNPATADQAAAAIALFEKSTGWKDFATFRIEQAIKFKRDLNAALHEKTGKPLQKATIRSRLLDVKAFFLWLADQQGYRSAIRYADCEYFNPSANDARVATARRERPVPTLDQIRHVIANAPHTTAIEQRDRALIAWTLLTGMRDSAIASLPIGKVDLERREVDQDARVVKTKNSKTMTTFFFPVGDDVEAVVAEWIAYLKTELHFGDSDPLFPQTEVTLNADGEFSASGLKREFWTSATAIRRIFRERFEAAGLPYFHPHSFRKTLAQLAYRLKLDLESAKAWSQNLGHEKPITTWTSYGKIDDSRTSEILSRLATRETPSEPTVSLTELEALVERLRKTRDA